MMTECDEMTSVDDGSDDDLANIIMIFIYLIILIKIKNTATIVTKIKLKKLKCMTQAACAVAALSAIFFFISNDWTLARSYKRHEVTKIECTSYTTC